MAIEQINFPYLEGEDELDDKILGRSLVVEMVRQLIRQVAPTEATVFVSGESGTGKELVARGIHDCSLRSKGPFVPINCGAIPADLLESELFGHEKGSFTGALAARAGRFELAAGGTIFLDEIGDMPLDMQVKLLRVLQEQTFQRIGGSREISADVRIIAATHQNLEMLVAEEKFRMDLYYRLHVIPIETPPLRNHPEDIPELIEKFDAAFLHDGKLEIQEDAMSALQQYDWPGNVRELINLVQRLAVMNPDKTIHIQDLPEKYRINLQAVFPLSTSSNLLPEEGINLRQHLKQLETQLITEALQRSNGVVARAAQLLELQRTTLVEKMRKLGIEKR